MTTTLHTKQNTLSILNNLSTTGTYTISNSVIGSASWANSSVLTVDNNTGLQVNGNVKINGKDLEERLDNIEKVLGIPETDPEMFRKYPSLKKKYDDYINELAKLRTWDALKG